MLSFVSLCIDFKRWKIMVKLTKTIVKPKRPQFWSLHHRKDVIALQRVKRTSIRQPTRIKQMCSEGGVRKDKETVFPHRLWHKLGAFSLNIFKGHPYLYLRAVTCRITDQVLENGIRLHCCTLICTVTMAPQM